MRSKHTMIATIPVGDPDLGAEVEAKITFNYTPGVAARIFGPPELCEPGYGATVEFVRAEPSLFGKPYKYEGAFADLELAALQDTCENWLESDDGYAEAINSAEADIERDREYAAELRAER